jgi:hypothetical protein
MSVGKRVHFVFFLFLTFPSFCYFLKVLNKRFIEEAETIKTVPDIRPGDIVEIKKVIFYHPFGIIKLQKRSSFIIFSVCS